MGIGGHSPQQQELGTVYLSLPSCVRALNLLFTPLTLGNLTLFSVSCFLHTGRDIDTDKLGHSPLRHQKHRKTPSGQFYIAYVC